MSVRMFVQPSGKRVPILLRVHAHGPPELAETIETSELYATRESWPAADGDDETGGVPATTVTIGRLARRLWRRSGGWRDHGGHVLLTTTTLQGDGVRLVTLTARLDPRTAREIAARLVADADAADAYAAEQTARRESG